VADGKYLPDVIPYARFTETWWSSDGKGFAYQAYPAPDGLAAVAVGAELRYHRLGSRVQDDAVLMANPDRPRDRYWVCCQESTGKVLMAIGPEQITYSWTPSLGATSPATPLFTVPVNPLPQVFHVGEGFLLVREYQGAARGRIVRIELATPDPTQWTTVVPEAADNLTGASVVGGRLILTYLQNAASRMRIVELDGSPVTWVDLPGLGSTGTVRGSASGRLASFTYSSFTQPPEVLQVDMSSGAVHTWRSPKLTFDPAQFVTTSVMVPSRDGTPVRAFMVRQRDVGRSGDNPTLLWGYGGFNIALTPEYRTEWLAWVQRGGVFVYANLRGGGEFGREWYLAGTKLRKQNVFDDFIAIAQWLKQRRWTDTSRLAITGRSNGGLLVGAVMTQQPDLAAVAIPQVGVFDMLRYQNFTIGASWARDYGRSDESPEMFAALFAYSPLHNVRPGVRYPATLITTAESDDRVVPAHSYKFAAALQAANASGKPTLVRIERGAGHGPGATRAQMIAQQADLLSFLDANLGVAPITPRPVFRPQAP
jgi:prolyl oligopeptidase